MRRLGQWLFLFIPNITKLTKFQREEYAKLWLNLSLLIFGSLIIKIFEPGKQRFDVYTIGTMIVGLTGFILCVRFGLYIGKEK